MGAGPSGEGGGGAITGCILIVCRYADGPITEGGWLLSGGRGAYKRKFTAVECHYQMSCQTYLSDSNLSDCQYCYYLFYSLYP